MTGGQDPQLHWREAGHDAASAVPLQPYDASAPACVNVGFRETGSYVISGIPAGWQFLVDDAPVALQQEADDGGAWAPGFYAGEVTAELRRPDGRAAALYLLDVAPDATKLGREAFDEMTRDLLETAPALLLGSEPATKTAGVLGELEDPWLAFSRMRRHGPEFVRALRAVQARPRRRLRVQRGSAPLHRVQRVDRATALSVLRSSAAALLDDRVEAPEMAHRARLDVPRTDDNVDCAPNRTLLVLARSVLRRIVDLRERLQRVVAADAANESHTRTSLAARWSERGRVLDVLATNVRAALRGSPFRDVRRAEVTAAGLTAITADTTYARAWGRGWRALRPGVSGSDDSERLWVSPSWQVYERWCFLALGRLLQEAPGWTWSLASHGNGWTWHGRGPEAWAELLLQPRFRAFNGTSTGCWSVSREREPDIVLAVHGPDGVRFTVFDAKYRTSRSAVLDAMASAHIYQDALRMGEQRPDATYLLVPAGGGATWLEEGAFQQEHCVGVLVCRPGQVDAVSARLGQLGLSRA